MSFSQFKMIKVKRGHYKMVLELVTETPRELQWGEITEKHTHLIENEIIKDIIYFDKESYELSK